MFHYTCTLKVNYCTKYRISKKNPEWSGLGALEAPSRTRAQFITWHEDVAKAQQWEGPVAQGERGEVEPGHFEHHGKLHGRAEQSSVSATCPSSLNRKWSNLAQAANLLVRGGVRGTSRDLHHYTLAALWSRTHTHRESVRVAHVTETQPHDKQEGGWTHSC